MYPGESGCGGVCVCGRMCVFTRFCVFMGGDKCVSVEVRVCAFVGRHNLCVFAEVYVCVEVWVLCVCVRACVCECACICVRGGTCERVCLLFVWVSVCETYHLGLTQTQVNNKQFMAPRWHCLRTQRSPSTGGNDRRTDGQEDGYFAIILHVACRTCPSQLSLFVTIPQSTD